MPRLPAHVNDGASGAPRGNATQPDMRKRGFSTNLKNSSPRPSRQGAARIFTAGRFWGSNVFGAALAGGLGGVLMLVVMGIVVVGNPTSSNVLSATGLALVLLASVACFVPGNLIAAYPYSVLLVKGRGLELRAPFKRLYIPAEDLREVRRASSLYLGYIVRLKRRNRLLKSFLISHYFGDQAESLAEAIREEIRSSGDTRDGT